jgi:hypothetical protein
MTNREMEVGTVQTECSAGQLEFQVFAGRRVEAAFNGGHQSSDAGVLLLREVAERTGLIRRFASYFTDHRRPERVEHTIEQLLGQRVFGQALEWFVSEPLYSIQHDIIVVAKGMSSAYMGLTLGNPYRRWLGRGRG